MCTTVIRSITSARQLDYNVPVGLSGDIRGHTMDEFEKGGIIVIAMEVLILIISIFMVRYFNKQIRQKRENDLLAKRRLENSQ